MGTRISELPYTHSVTNDTVVPVVQDETTYKLQLGSIVTEDISSLNAKAAFNNFKYTYTSANGTIASSTNYSDVGSEISLEPGLWMVVISVTFAQNSTGYRSIRFYYNGDSFEYVTNAAVSGQPTRMQLVYPIKITQERPYKIQLKQNSGSSLNYSFACKVLGINHNF